MTVKEAKKIVKPAPGQKFCTKKEFMAACKVLREKLNWSNDEIGKYMGVI